MEGENAMQGLNIIFNGVFGSALYGLSTPSSDEDYKGGYMPTEKELIFNKYKDSIEIQTDEVDYGFYAATKFVKILSKCDTVSNDMIHTPQEFTLTSTPLWEKIRSHRSDLYCKSARGLLGYIRTQALKYSHKQERFKEMKELLGLILGTNLDVKIKDTTLPEIIQRSGFKFIKHVPAKGDVSGNIDVCGSRYQLNSAVGYLTQGVEQKLSRYGERTKEGDKKGGDFKSMSHSYRVLIQMKEMIETRDIIFPLVKAPEIMKVKLGEIPTEDVMAKLDDVYHEVVALLEQSDLPEDADVTNIENVIMNDIMK